MLPAREPDGEFGEATDPTFVPVVAVQAPEAAGPTRRPSLCQSAPKFSTPNDSGANNSRPLCLSARFRDRVAPDRSFNSAIRSARWHKRVTRANSR